MTIGVTRSEGAIERDRVIEPTGPPPTDPPGAPAAAGILVYGADWCGDTRRSRRLLDLLEIPYAEVDIESQATTGAWAAAQNGGERRIPVVVLPDAAGVLPAALLVEPSDDELLTALRRAGYLGSADSPDRTEGAVVGDADAAS